jgi:hypothetical protein
MEQVVECKYGKKRDAQGKVTEKNKRIEYRYEEEGFQAEMNSLLSSPRSIVPAPWSRHFPHGHCCALQLARSNSLNLDIYGLWLLRQLECYNRDLGDAIRNASLG